MKKSFILLTLIILVLFTGVTVEAKDIKLNILAGSSTNCTGYFGDKEEEGSLMNLIVYDIFRPIKWIVPILLLAFTTFDFSKVVFTDSKDGMEKAKKDFVKRAIVAVVIFFIPTLLEIVFEIIDTGAIRACMNNF